MTGRCCLRRMPKLGSRLSMSLNVPIGSGRDTKLVWCFAIDTPYWPLIWHDLFLVLGFTPSFPRRRESKFSVFSDTQLNWIPACPGMTVLL